MEQMEFRDNKMETERLNNRKILGEVRYIVVIALTTFFDFGYFIFQMFVGICKFYDLPK